LAEPSDRFREFLASARRQLPSLHLVLSRMEQIEELGRHASPAGQPQPLAFLGSTLWIGCWDTTSLYAIDSQTWNVLEHVPAPGRPYGLAAVNGELRVVVSIGEDDDRFFYRFVPGEGFDAASKLACPNSNGSHLTYEGETLYLVQATNKRILALGADLSVQREIALPARIAGIGHREGAFFAISADDEFDNLILATLDISGSTAVFEDIAVMPVESRALAFDGTSWWTNLRESNAILSFNAPAVAAGLP